MRSRALVPGGTEAAATSATVLDPEAFAALYREHRDALYRYCIAKTGDRDRAEDLMQEVFAKAFASRSRFDPHRPFWPWLASIAVRECIDAHRRRSHAASRFGELARSTVAEPVDLTSTAVLRAMEERRLADDIASLPMRQRVALQLVALDGWSYADVAAHLGYSVSMVKALIVRARRKLRAAAVESLGAVAGVGRALRARWRRVVSAPNPVSLFGAWPMPSFSFSSTAVATVAAVVAVAVGGPTVVTSTPEPGASELGVAVPWPFDVVNSAPDASEAKGPRPARDGVLARDVEHTANEVLAAALPVNGAMSPETVPVSSFTMSPNYEDDHTVFLVGDAGADVLTPPMFVSRDGGASWQRLRALGLASVVRFLLPPAYPDDGRLFALTRKGVQVSHDGGDTFETAVTLPSASVFFRPSLTGAAVSPAFHMGDSSLLLVVGYTLLEYRVDTGELRSVALGPELAGHEVNSVAYAVDDPTGRTVLLGSRGSAGLDPFTFSRCTKGPGVGGVGEALACRPVTLPERVGFDLPIRLPASAGSNAVFAAFPLQPYVSLDGGRSFRPTRPVVPGFSSFVSDLAPVPTGTGNSAIVAQVSFRMVDGQAVYGPQLARTDDAGETWEPIHVDVPNFSGASKVVATPTGRVIAANRTAGIACSEDGGRTWARLCPTPDTA